jgi:hypothetical protein
MKKFLRVLVTVMVVTVLLGALTVVTAQWLRRHGRGMGRIGPGMLMGPGFSGTTAAQISDEKAKELAQQYADKNLPGFEVERAIPSTGMPHTMYSVELKNAQGELRSIHITPFGGVMPFGGPAGRS